jgi:dTMP kinase
VSARRGLLVAFEGIDGAGKTTQARRLRAHLARIGLDVVLTKEPTAGPHGRRLRESARCGRLPPAEELETFIADRREHVASLIAPALAAGRAVLVDRYYFSNAAYQGARGLDPREILRRNASFAPRPDLALLLEIGVDTAITRIEARGGGANLFERRVDLEAVARGFRELGDPALRHLDGEREELVIHEEIVQAVDELLRRREA